MSNKIILKEVLILVKQKICPLRQLEASSTNIIDDQIIFCRPDCAWFNEIDQECSILTLGKSMAETAFNLQTIESNLDK
jgi:hypothetical protein